MPNDDKIDTLARIQKLVSDENLSETVSCKMYMYMYVQSEFLMGQTAFKAWPEALA